MVPRTGGSWLRQRYLYTAMIFSIQVHPYEEMPVQYSTGQGFILQVKLFYFGHQVNKQNPHTKVKVQFYNHWFSENEFGWDFTKRKIALKEK